MAEQETYSLTDEAKYVVEANFAAAIKQKKLVMVAMYAIC